MKFLSEAVSRTDVALPTSSSRSALPLERVAAPHRASVLLSASQIEAGLRFIEKVAARPGIFRRYGGDLLFCFFHFARTSPPGQFRRRSLHVARRLARRWRVANRRAPARLSPDRLLDRIIGHSTANRLGQRDIRRHESLEAAVRRFTPEELLRFDPRRSPPPAVSRRCDSCMGLCARGRNACPKCGRASTTCRMQTAWLDALIVTYFGDAAGIRMGTSLPAVVRWLPHVRRALRSSLPALPGFPDDILGVTHLVYVLTDYNRRAMPRGRFDLERRLLRLALPRACAKRDLEVVGEIVEVFRILSEPLDTGTAREAISLIHSSQNGDGSWGPRRTSWYTRYHTTWTCLDALRPYLRREGAHSTPD